MTRRHPRRHQQRRNKQANAAAQQHTAPAAVYDAPDAAVAVSEVAISPIPSPDVPVEADVVEPAIEAIPPPPPRRHRKPGPLWPPPSTAAVRRRAGGWRPWATTSVFFALVSAAAVFAVREMEVSH